MPIASPFSHLEIVWSRHSFVEVDRSQSPVLRVHEVGAVGVGRVRNAGGLAAEPHSMDRRLHNVVRRDVVVPWQWQPSGLHGDPATVTMLYTPTINKPLFSS